jgi:hypothetical protein
LNVSDIVHLQVIIKYNLIHSWHEQYSFQAHILNSFDTFYASGYLLDALREGKILPAAALWDIQKLQRTESGKFSQNIWTEEEREPFLFPEEFITPEWSKFVSQITALNIK